MRDYIIYLIEEEFARHYFGRESLMYHLFLEHEKTNSTKKEILQKQIEFITKSIPSLRIHHTIEASLKQYKTYTFNMDSHTLEMREFTSTACLTIQDRYIHIQSKGSYEAETAFFEVLRKYDRCFLAMDFRTDRYGWLTPVKERKFI